ncbi:MAG: bifunctional DNA-formamidopyrimidine glycosylase/DNA-(apurinic or apyrimidinic site) lyase [Nitrospinaceae bacterium]|jgi:formamidopyrimidine-DNA glycosylase|nr:MAG: bifunctional DNA-formamidopyrimidine glycosylase/DNA-(apurinic or apyrimidinic site) lyase [Nitrospinaceae bacterium]
MPELPEVETLRRALVPLVENRTCLEMRFFRSDLRFPIPTGELKKELLGRKVSSITRAGKYLLLNAPGGAMLWHLGMSGRVTQRPSMEPVEKHTHAVFRFSPGTCLHFVDPRRFGAIAWAPSAVGHRLLRHLGPDPFSAETTAAHFKTKAKNCRAPVKAFLMDSKRLSGVGNIYACEALFTAGIRPARRAGKLSLADWDRLLEALRDTLNKSIDAGGTTLRDFFNPAGDAGYYAVDLAVYGREGEPCRRCRSPIRRRIDSGRSTFYCRQCQKR